MSPVIHADLETPSSQRTLVCFSFSVRRVGLGVPSLPSKLVSRPSQGKEQLYEPKRLNTLLDFIIQGRDDREIYLFVTHALAYLLNYSNMHKWHITCWLQTINKTCKLSPSFTHSGQHSSFLCQFVCSWRTSDCVLQLRIYHLSRW